MRIGFVLCEHPLDIRIKKEARSLKDAGHEVFGLLRVSQNGNGSTSDDSITVDTYPASSHGEAARALTFFKRMSFAPIAVEKRIEKFVRDHGIDVIHVHDLPNVGPGIRVGRRLGLPVVADLHENYSAAVRIQLEPLKLHHWITANQTLWRSYQKRCLHRADQVIVVIEESRDCMLGYGISKDKVHVVPNYVDLDYLLECRNNGHLDVKYDGRFVISYIGGIGRYRGLEVAVRAMAPVAEKAPDALLLIIGNECDYSNYLRRLIAELKLERNVEMLGWQSFEKVPGFVAASNIGLIPHQRNAHCDNTIPNKLFDYMGFEIPVAVSDCPPLARIVNESESGLVFKADSPQELADSILKLHADKELGAKLGANGVSAVKSRYNWDTAAVELVKVYEELAR